MVQPRHTNNSVGASVDRKLLYPFRETDTEDNCKDRVNKSNK